MPLFQDLSDRDRKIWIWIHEETETLHPEKYLNAEELEKVANCHPKRAAEIIAVRKIKSELLPGHEILYSESGQPYLDPRDFEISISHSFPFVAVGISKQKIGLDIEQIREKILKIEHKFILNEASFLPEGPTRKDYLTAIWSIKESLYKIHASNYWSLKKNYEVYPFDINKNEKIRCRVYNESESEDFFAQLNRFGNFLFATVSESLAG